jgi:hypothetical protein
LRNAPTPPVLARLTREHTKRPAQAGTGRPEEAGSSSSRYCLAVYGLAGLDFGSAFRAEKWAAPGEVSLDGVDDEGESPSGDFAGGLDCSVGGASSGLGLDFGGHDLPPVIALGRWPG